MGKNILLLMALIVGAMTACSGSNSLSNLAMGTYSPNAGTVDFQGSSGSPNGLTTSSFTHTFPTPFTQTPAVAFGTRLLIQGSGTQTSPPPPPHNSVSSAFKWQRLSPPMSSSPSPANPACGPQSRSVSGPPPVLTSPWAPPPQVIIISSRLWLPALFQRRPERRHHPHHELPKSHHPNFHQRFRPQLCLHWNSNTN